MIVGLSTQTYNIEGDLILDYEANSTNLHKVTRRLSRTATIDGGGVVTDFGYAEIDRDFILVVIPKSYSDLEILLNMAKNYGSLLLTTIEGAFKVSVEQIETTGGGSVTLNLMAQGS